MKNSILLYGVLFSVLFYSCADRPKDQSKEMTVTNEKITKLGGVFTFTEGPVADQNGDVYFTDQPTNRIIKWEAGSGLLTTFLSN